MKDQRNGFPRYSDPKGAVNASAVIMKFIKMRGLRETTQQTSTSLRHTFKDRMRFHKILAAAFLSRALSLEKAIPIEVKSSEYGGRKRSRTPTFSMASRTGAARARGPLGIGQG